MITPAGETLVQTRSEQRKYSTAGRRMSTSRARLVLYRRRGCQSPGVRR